MDIVEKKYKNGDELHISLDQEFFSNSSFDHMFGFELFSFQYWHDYYPFEHFCFRLAICSVCLRIHFYKGEQK